MPLDKTFVPYGAYWSTPFCRWQGSLAEQHAIKLAAQVAARFLADRKIGPETLDEVVLGITVPQRQAFYGAPWLSGLLGAPGITGPTVSQACATSVRMLQVAALEIEAGLARTVLAVACDRTSNGPHVYYPSPAGPGGKGEAEDVVWDSFAEDPHAGLAMIATAENVASEAGIDRSQQEAMTLVRYSQYQDALANDRAFQRRYMVSAEFRKGRATTVVEADEGVFPTTAAGLAGLKPGVPGGSVTFGSQTHPADGNAGMLLCSRERAKELARDASITVQVLGFGQARVKKGFMPQAAVPAARQALELAGVALADCKAIKTHNPFAVNDVYFCRELGLAPERVNRFGSSLVWGHPQAPTGLRSIAELIEELVLAGGGYGLFSGCAAGDTAMAVVLRVS